MIRLRRHRRASAGVLAGVVIARMALHAPGATLTWTGNASTDWATAGNWDGNVVPGPGDVVVIDGGARQPHLDLADGGVTVSALSIGASLASTVTLWNADAAAKCLNVAGNCTIGPRGVLTHADNSASPTHLCHLRVGGDCALQTGGKIDVTGLGYDAMQGPGFDTRPGASATKGGAYGGQGRGYGDNADYNGIQYPCGNTYGSVTMPMDLGSGGESQPGGGAVLLDIGGAATIQGQVLADGFGGNRAGSGGSIFLRTGTLLGSGTVQANGGAGIGSGGGGRIAVIVSNGTDTAGISIAAFGGASGTYVAAAGTVFVRLRDDLYGRLIVDNNGKSIDVQAVNGELESMTGIDSPAGLTLYRFDRVTVTNCGILLIRTNAILDLANEPQWLCDSTIGNLRARVVFDPSEGAFAFPARYTFTNVVLSQRGTGTVSWAAGIALGKDALLTHERGGSLRNDERHKLNLQIGGDFDILPGGAIWVSGAGYAPARGPGYQNVGSVSVAGHGGEGRGYTGSASVPCGYTYGSLTRPVHLGSGGAGAGGGGAVRLRVTGVSRIDGAIRANAPNASKTGSGGSVSIETAGMSGTGVVEALSFGVGGGGAGGGGRIAVVLTGGDNFGAVAFNAAGGSGGSYHAAGGTIYLKTAAESFGKLIVTNHAVATTATTLISSNVTDSVVGDVEIKTNGLLAVAARERLTVRGSWSNAGAFMAAPGSTVELAGTNAATVTGTTAFSELVCTAAAKRVDFQAGKSVSVSNRLRLAGAPGAGNLLTLRSTAPGAPWLLKLTGGTAQSVSYVSVADSDATGGDPIDAVQCHDAGNNSNWVFAATGPITWTGGASSDWATGGNWDRGRPPIPSDTAVIVPGVSSNQPVLDANREIAAPLAIQTGASLRLNGHDLTVNGHASIAGALVAAASETVTFKGNADFSGGVFSPRFSRVVLGGSIAQTLTPNGQSFYVLANGNAAAPLVVSQPFRAQAVVFASNSIGAAFQSGFTVGLFRCEAPGADLAFQSGAAYVATDLMLCGAPSARLALRGSTAGAPWYLAVAGWRYARDAQVQDSDASGGQRIYAVQAVDGGGNRNWDFGAWSIWSGGASSDFADPANWAAGQAPNAEASVLVDGHGANAPAISGNVAVARVTVGATQASLLTINSNLTVTGDLLVMERGTLTHAANSAATAAEPYKLGLTVGGDLSVLAGGKLDVTAKGFPPLLGPGSTTNTYGGAAHGGQGCGWNGLVRIPVGRCYGSFLQPTDLGSGGNQRAGGGAMRLTIGGTLALNGQILAEGDTANGGLRTGSGGSIWIATGALTGTGRVSVASYAGDAGGGAGGGGRMAVEVLQGTNFGGVAFSARGGIASNGSYRAGAGSIFRKSADMAFGALLIDNETVPPGEAATELPPALHIATDELRDTVLVLTNTAWVVLTTNATVGDLLILTTNAFLTTASHRLYVRAAEHDLANPGQVTPGPNTNRVDNYAHIVWLGRTRGSVFTIR